MMTEDAMTEDRFWALIARTTAYEADPERQLEALRQALRELTASEIEAFERAFQRAQRRAYTWDLWGAAYVLHGGASDDGFEYFQRWLISKGRDVFEAAVADPDSLADMLAPDIQGPCEFEEFAYVASEVWGEKTGIDPWRDPKGSFPYTGAPPAASPSGIPFEENERYLAKRYPKLWKRFGNSPLEKEKERFPKGSVPFIPECRGYRRRGHANDADLGGRLDHALDQSPTRFRLRHVGALTGEALAAIVGLLS